MNLRDLRYAATVAELGHFGRAAEACHVSQPALSGQIRKLEDELGVRLFERTNRAVRITPVGEAIIAQAREVLDHVERLRATAAAHRDPMAGTLRLGMIPTIGPYLTPVLLPGLRQAMPTLEVRLREDVTLAIEEMLLEGELDAAVTATPPGDPRLEAIPLYDEPFWVALPNGHPLAGGDEVDIHAIRPDELLLLADGHCLRDQVLHFCELPGQSTAPIDTHRTSLTTILALVGAGAGVTLVPATSLREAWVTDFGIAVRREASGKAARAVRLVFRRSFPRRRMLERLADTVCATVPDTVAPARPVPERR